MFKRLNIIIKLNTNEYFNIRTKAGIKLLIIKMGQACLSPNKQKQQKVNYYSNFLAGLVFDYFG